MKFPKIKGLIIEWIAGTGKTTFLKNFLKSKQWINKQNLSSLVLSEHYTQRILEKKDKQSWLLKQDNINLLNNILLQIESCAQNSVQLEWLGNDHNFLFILERFHLTHVYRYDHINWEDVTDIDRRLNNVNAQICLFVIEKDDIKPRIIDEYIKFWWWDYLKNYGNNEKDIIENYWNKQQLLLKTAQKSCIPIKIINTSKTLEDKAFQEILNFWNI